MILSGGFHSCYLFEGQPVCGSVPHDALRFQGVNHSPSPPAIQWGCLPTYGEIGMASICRVATCRDCLAVDWPALTDWSLQGNDLKFTGLQSRQVATLQPIRWPY